MYVSLFSLFHFPATTIVLRKDGKGKASAADYGWEIELF
jgi:hypothetical protein